MTAENKQQPIVQLFFLESSHADLDKILTSSEKDNDNVVKHLREVEEYGKEWNNKNVKILTAKVEAGKISKIGKYGTMTKGGPEKIKRIKGKPKEKPKIIEPRSNTIEGVSALRFALGQMRSYSTDLGTVNVPFVQIDNHPDFRKGIRFTYFNKAEVKAKGGKTTDETLGHARYEFLDGNAKTFAPVTHSFPTYAMGPAITSQLGDHNQIPLVLYLTQKEKNRGNVHIDTESIDIGLCMVVEAHLGLGTLNLEKGGYRTSLMHAQDYAERRMDLIKSISSSDRIINARRRNTLIQMGRCHEALNQTKSALVSYRTAIDYVKIPDNPTIHEQKDIDFAKSAVERINIELNIE